MRVSVLGPLVVEPSVGGLSPRDRVVLTALALHAGEVVSGERLADALWGEDVPASWNKVVQGCIVRLRKALGTGTISTEPLGYRLVVDADAVDARRFEHAVARARELLALGEPERAMYAAEEALELWRGRPLADADDWEPAQVEAHRLEELRMDAEELRTDAGLRAGRHRDLLASARAYVEAAPTRERRWELLALALYRSGRQGDALRTLHEARLVLGRELGVDPGPALVALERAVLAQEPSLDVPEAPPVAGSTCPWPGLLAYDVGDAEGFFGRDDETEACLARLTDAGALVVVGPSGSGKSSLVRAGVAARLRRNGRSVRVVVPTGPRPLDALPGSWPASAAQAVLVVDQCEAVAAPGVDPAGRDAFLDAVVEHAGRAPVVVALRADRIGELSAHRGFAHLVERGLFLLGPMDEAQVRAAIEGPARRAALLLEPGLVDLVVRDVRAEPGALPLMSHALHETWSRREDRVLTVAAYRETGGIAGAVARSAEDVYTGAEPADREKLRDLLLRLVAPQDDGTPSPVRLPRPVVTGDPAYPSLVERLVAARLVTSDEHAVELAHEAVARAWPRLQEWLDEDVDGSRVLRHLATTAAGWDALGRPASELYRGVRLAQARDWRQRARPRLTAVEEAFLEASDLAEADELRAAQAQVAAERRTVRRLRRLVAGVALLALVATVAGWVAVEQRDRADDEADVAAARRIAAEALVARPHDRALLLAVEAVRRWDSAETRGNLLTTIDRSPRVAGIIRSAGDRFAEFDVAPSGSTAAVVDVGGNVALYDLGTRAETAFRSGDGRRYAAPAFSPDGEDLALAASEAGCFADPGCRSHGVTVLAVDDLGAPGTTYQGLADVAVDLAYSRDGDLLAAAPSFAIARPSHNVAVWRVGEPDAPMRLFTLPDRGADFRPTPDSVSPGFVAFSPDGTRLYASGAGPTVAFDIATGDVVARYEGRGSLGLSPDGEVLAVATTGTGVDLVETATGEVVAELRGHDAAVTAATFSADGRRVATTSNDETVVVWDSGSGKRLDVLEGHAGSVLAVAFAGRSPTLYSSAADRSIFVWDLEGGSGLTRPLAAPTPDLAREGEVHVAPTGATLAVIGRSSRLVDVATGRSTDLEAATGGRFAWVAFSPDGDRLAAVGRNGTTTLWDARTGDRLAVQPGRGTENWGSVAFAADGATVVVADADGTVVELDGATLEPSGRSVDVGVGVEPLGIRTAPDARFAVIAHDGGDGTDVVFGDLATGSVSRRAHVDVVAPRTNFNADGTRFAAGGFDGRLAVIDVRTGEVAGRAEPVHQGPVAWVAFAPDGATLASIGFDGALVLSDPATAIPRARSRPGPPNTLASLAYAADGHTVVLGYRDGLVLAHDTDPDAWVAHACRVAGRDLTVDEWRDAFGDEPHRSTCPARMAADG